MSMLKVPSTSVSHEPPQRPRVAFLGVGWIGRHRLQSIVETKAIEVACIADIDGTAAAAACDGFDGAVIASNLEEALATDPHGLVIATPNALHAQQAISALRRGIAVFCQKPLARTREETQAVVNAARETDCFLAVDFSYRYMKPCQQVAELIRAGQLGEVFALDLVFHNAFGPDKPWFYDPTLSGGGCLIDLGVHLVDLALWWTGFPKVETVSSTLYHKGAPLRDSAKHVEDFASVSLHLAGGSTVRISCSWDASVGRDAVIEATVHGSRGGASIRNVDGSFFDFVAHCYRNRGGELLHEPPDGWFGRAAGDWAERLAAGARFDDSIQSTVAVAEVLDRAYGRI